MSGGARLVWSDMLGVIFIVGGATYFAVTTEPPESLDDESIKVCQQCTSSVPAVYQQCSMQRLCTSSVPAVLYATTVYQQCSD